MGKKTLLLFYYVLAVSAFSYAQNPIVIENAIAGTPISDWGVPDFRDNRIAGFATKMSLNSGETVRFKINVQSGSPYTLKIYRLGYYQGNGARLMANLGSFTGVVQPTGISDASTGILDCSNWSESANWTIPGSAVSGFYIARIERTGGGSNHIAFIVRNDNSSSAIYYQLPDATWQAYNGYGGNSMYDGNTSWPAGHAVKVSYNRPFFPYNSLFNTDGREADWYMNATYPMIRWLERNGYDVTYTGSNDISRNGSRILNHKVFMGAGHDEYYSKEMRASVEAARDAGVHLAFFTGNDVYWKTRWENNSGTEDRTLVCYKEGALGDGTLGERTCGYKCDPSGEWTGLWRTGGDYDAGKPENSLLGQISWVEYPAEIGVPAYYKKLRFWRNSAVANLTAGQTSFLGINTLGYEWDYEQPVYASSNPPGRITMSSRTVNNLTHKLSLYRHSSGALVFGAGTVQWSWGLDGEHWGGTTTVSADMQQATINLLADMNVQPGTIQPGLTAASKSTDHTDPTTTITSPANNSSFIAGSTITISGTATDAGGGVVGGVEISTDGGVSWTATEMTDPDGSTTWTYSWITSTSGTFSIKTRGVDDSGNQEAPGTGINIIVGTVDNTAPTVTSVSPLSGSTNISVSTNVTANFNEAILGSSVTNSSFQLRDAGSNLVSATVSSSGNQISLTPAATLNPSATYTATISGGTPGVKDAAGNPLANNYTWSFVTGAASGACPCTVFQPANAPTTARANDEQGIEVGMRFRSTQNGFITGIRYYKGSGTTGTHIGSLWNNSGSSRLAQANFTNETASGWQQVSFSSPVAITAGVTYVASYYSPSGDYAATKPYFTQAVVNGPLRGLADGEDGANGLYRYAATSAFPNSSFQSSNYWVDVVFATTAGTVDNTPPTVTSVTPQSGATGVSTATTIVANFSEAINSASVTGSTFQLRDAGNNLVTATVSGSGSQATISPAAALAGSTVYTATITGGLSGVKDIAGNALANNYSWSFTTASVDNTAPTVTTVSPLNGASGVSSGTTVIANFSEAINSSSVTTSSFQLRNAGNSLIPATVSTSSNQVTLVPSSALAGGVVYTVTIQGGISGVRDLAGNVLVNNYTWSFTTASVDNTPPTVVSVSPANGTTSVSTNTSVSANFNETINAATVTASTFQLRDAGNNLVAATINTSSGQISLTPSAALSASTIYTVTIVGGTSGVKDLAANALVSNYTWSFTTAAGGSSGTNFTVFQPTDAPTVANANDEQGIELGMRFRTTQNGFITGVRYYKGAGSTGVHIGSLWNNAGTTRLAQATFTNETASGWQQVLFSSPVAVTTGVTYVVSYFSPSGDYAATKPYFTQAVVNGPLRGLADGEDGGNGLYRYTASSAFPNGSFQSSNYWADVVFTATTGGTGTAPTVTTQPVSQAVCAGTSISFTSAANGTPIPTIQWQVSTTSGSSWSNISGATAATLTFNTTAADNNKQYRAVWTNSTSAVNSNPATLTVNAIPGSPIVTVANNCGSSTLTASAFTGSLLWSTGATTASITVTTAGTYTVTQTVAGCTSPAGSGVAAPANSNVPTPTVTVVNNCGSSTLTAGAFTGSLLWSTGATTASITVTTAGTYTVTQTVSGCTSPAGNGVAAPINSNVPAPTVTVVNNCGSSTLTAGAFTGSLLWSTGATTASITVTTAGTYTVTQTVSGCTSASGNGVAAPANANVSTPTVTVANNCGSSTLTASAFTGSLLWSTGATTASITVTTAGTYTVTQTVSGCTSPAGNGVAAPVNSNVPAPTVTVVNNCGSSTLTASAFTGSLLWSNGATTAAITVTTAGTYTVTQTVSGCTSPAGNGVAAPVNSNVPAPTVTVVNNCGSSTLTASAFTGSLVWSNGATTASITVTTAGTYTVTQTVTGCTSPSASAVAAPKTIPSLTSNLAATFTSGVAFVYTPTSTVAGTTFTWTRAAVAGISNAAGNGSGNISETLTNTTASAVAVTYVYTLTANGCTNTQNVVITISPAQSVNCKINGSITSSFNSTSIRMGRYIWFNSVLDRGTLTGTAPVTFTITNSVITFTANNRQYTLTVPNATIRFDASVTSATTQFVNNAWQTLVPRSYSSYAFMTGLSYLVPANLPGSISNINWSADISINQVGVSATWKWGAAVYSSFADHPGLYIKAINGLTLSPFPNLDNAGTPENFRVSLISGAKGSGGINYTGNYSSTRTATCSTVGTRSSEENLITGNHSNLLPELSLEKIYTGKLDAEVMPNPSSTFFTLAIKGKIDGPVTVRIIDIFGRVVERHEKIAANTILQIGHKWTSGSYFAELIQGDQRTVVKIIKAR